jgi:hypothetical protein
LPFNDNSSGVAGSDLLGGQLGTITALKKKKRKRKITPKTRRLTIISYFSSSSSHNNIFLSREIREMKQTKRMQPKCIVRLFHPFFCLKKQKEFEFTLDCGSMAFVCFHLATCLWPPVK